MSMLMPKNDQGTRNYPSRKKQTGSVAQRQQVEFFALQRLGYPALPNGPGQEDRERDGMLVACSWSGR